MIYELLCICNKKYRNKQTKQFILEFTYIKQFHILLTIFFCMKMHFPTPVPSHFKLIKTSSKER